MSDRDIVPETLDIVRVLKNEDRLSTDRLVSPSTPLVLSNGSDMETKLKTFTTMRQVLNIFKKCIRR